MSFRLLTAFCAVTTLVASTASGQSANRGGSPLKRVPFDDPFRIGYPELFNVNSYRDASGKPGPDYWQQKVDYDIRVTLDTAGGMIDGVQTIRYTNNSPTSLEFVWIHLDQNIYSEGSASRQRSGWIPKRSPLGVTLSEVTVDGQSVTPELRGTLARIDLPRAIPARGGKASIRMRFRYKVPALELRMGKWDESYLMAQWNPRMVVFDDVRGWNADEYYGSEFYLEYGDFHYAITVPAGYTVAGSGDLVNATEVLTAGQRARLARARTDTGIVAVITTEEARAQSTRKVPGTKTWKFSAINVRDVAWIAAPDFRWDATNWDGILCQALYPLRAGPDWAHGAEQTRWTVKFYSERIGRYPYPQATAVGMESGMEHPMLGAAGSGRADSSDDANFLILNHEIGGHQYFPMIVGSNERRWGWMDEGFNNYYNEFAMADRARDRGKRPKDVVIAADIGLLMTRLPGTMMHANDYGGSGDLAYARPAATLLTLRNSVVGRADMDRAMRAYYERWKFKHPTPGDFFRTIENVAGQDLSWFWKGFFYSNEVLDIGIDSVFVTPRPEQRTSGWTAGADIVQSAVRLRRHTSIPFPVTMRVKFADGSTRDLSLPVAIFASETADITVTATSPVVGARLWPHQVREKARNAEQWADGMWPLGSVPDVNAANDTWGNAPPATPSAESPTSGGLPPLRTKLRAH
jgi:hypothetical protein